MILSDPGQRVEPARSWAVSTAAWPGCCRPGHRPPAPTRVPPRYLRRAHCAPASIPGASRSAGTTAPHTPTRRDPTQARRPHPLPRSSGSPAA